MDDIEAIKQLKGRYCRTMDTKDWEAMRQVFTDDVEMDTRASGGVLVTGADEFMAFLQEAIGDVVTVHQCHTPEIDLTGATMASGVWAMEDMLAGPTAPSCTATGTTTRRTRRPATSGASGDLS